MSLWEKIDLYEESRYHLDSDDDCYFAYEFVIGEDWNCEDNGLIFNIKKKVHLKGTSQWKHKINAIKQFARELADGLDNRNVIAPMPTSKPPSDPGYDSRIVDVVNEIKRLKPGVIVEHPIEITQKIPPAHGGGERDPDYLIQFFEWKGFQNPTDHVFLVDDMITSGGHFKACKKLILSHCPGIEVIGVFWTKGVNKNPFTAIDQ